MTAAAVCRAGMRQVTRSLAQGRGLVSSRENALIINFC